MSVQLAKEKASVLAARRGLSLFTQGHQVWGMGANGQAHIVCGNRVQSELWSKAVTVLLRDREQQTPGAFRLECPDGLFVADSMLALVFRWCMGRSEPFRVSDDAQVG